MPAGMQPSEDEKTLIDLQEKIMAGSQAMNRLNQQERMAMNRQQRTELTISELAAVPDETRMYKSVGKAYFLSTKPALVTEAKELVATTETEITSLRTQKGVVEQKMREAEKDFKELLQGKQLAGLRAA